MNDSGSRNRACPHEVLPDLYCPIFWGVGAFVTPAVFLMREFASAKFVNRHLPNDNHLD